MKGLTNMKLDFKKDYQIGEKVVLELEIVKSENGCKGCIFEGEGFYGDSSQLDDCPKCSANERQDKTDVIFANKTQG